MSRETNGENAGSGGAGKSLIINVLIALLGISAGVGMSHISIISNLHAAQVTLAQHEKSIEYITENVKRTSDTHTQTLDLMRELVNQNTFLLQELAAAGHANKKSGGG